jgi:type I restriction enzyme R subunit
MPTPGEHKTVQARILGYAEAIGWTIVSREEAEQRRGFDPDVPPADRAKNRSLFFDDLLDAKVREFNPRYAAAEGALLGQFRHLHTDVYGNRGRPINQTAHIVMNCDNVGHGYITRHKWRLD